MKKVQLNFETFTKRILLFLKTITRVKLSHCIRFFDPDSCLLKIGRLFHNLTISKIQIPQVLVPQLLYDNNVVEEIDTNYGHVQPLYVL